MYQKLIRTQAKSALRGRHGEAWAVLVVCLLALGMLLLAELGATALLLELGWHTGGADAVLSGALLCGRILLGFCLLVPPVNGAVWWFVQAAAGECNDAGTVKALYVCRRLNGRAGLLYGLLWGIALLLLLPPVCCVLGVRYLLAAALLPDASPWLLFAAAQLILLFAALLFWRGYLLLGLLPAVFLFAEQPLTSPWRLLRRSLCIMRGRRLLAVSLFLRELPCLLVIPVVFLLPRLCMQAAVFVRYAQRETPLPDD